jgi:hypothetical protein
VLFRVFKIPRVYGFEHQNMFYLALLDSLVGLSMGSKHRSSTRILVVHSQRHLKKTPTGNRCLTNSKVRTCELFHAFCFQGQTSHGIDQKKIKSDSQSEEKERYYLYSS